MSDWRERISIDPAIHHGDPCIRGTRVPVSVVVGSIEDGDSVEVVLDAYPSITRADVEAALAFAASGAERQARKRQR
jgi:uncharacterized protein (DUF433 family)